MTTRIKHVLVVAGPSGAGKTTFLTRLAAKELPEQISASLPRGAEEWPQLERIHFKYDPWPAVLSEREEITGVVLHYKVTKMDYHEDPALVLLGMAEEISVVNLVPTAGRLVSQLSHREATLSVRQLQWLGWRANRFLCSTVPKAASFLPRQWTERLLRVPWTSKIWSTLKARGRKNPIRKLRLYRQEDYLDDLYRSWQAYLQSLVCAGAKIDQIFVEPAENARLGQPAHWVKTAAPQLFDARSGRERVIR